MSCSLCCHVPIRCAAVFVTALTAVAYSRTAAGERWQVCGRHLQIARASHQRQRAVGQGHGATAPRGFGQADDLLVEVVQLVHAVVVGRAQHLAQFLQVGHRVRISHRLQLIQRRVGDLARPLDVPPVCQPDGGHSLRIRVHHLTFGRTVFRAYLAAYRLLAYQLLGLVLGMRSDRSRLQSSRLARLRIAPSLCLALLRSALGS